MKSMNKLIINPVDLPIVCVSLFVDTGMKNDSICGISHLIEHIIIEEFKKKEPELFRQNLINGYIDKEFTCFHATVLRKDLNKLLIAFSGLYDCMKKKLSDEVVKSQKEIIYNIENERILSNPQLINILLLEQLAFIGEVKKTTIVDETFLTLSEKQIREFCNQTYLSSQHYLIISGDLLGLNIEELYNNGRELISTPNVIENKTKSVSIPLDKINDINDIRKIIAISIDSVDGVNEYYALHIICLLYKVYINNLLKDTDVFLNNITFKLYTEKIILFFNYNKNYDRTLPAVSAIKIESCGELLENVKKHFFYGYLQKSCNLIEFNKEIYKVARFFGENLNFKNIVGFINSVDFNDIEKIHNKILSGKYSFVSEGILNGYV